jgi:NADPH2:quinone reductase
MLSPMSQNLFDVVASGAVDASMPLAEAAEAHGRLEGRQTVLAKVQFPEVR